MPTLLRHKGIEPWTLPRPWLKVMKAGKTGYLRLDPPDVVSLIGSGNIPPEVQMELVSLTQVPLGGFDDLDPFDDERLNTVTTTDATVTTIWSDTLADNTAYRFEAIVVARGTAAAARATYHRVCTVYREAAGAATLQGAVLAPTTDAESVAGWDVTFDVTGNTLRLRVTGAAATAIRWNARITNILASS